MEIHFSRSAKFGDKYGKWEFLGLKKVKVKCKSRKTGFKNKVKWICKCECGSIHEILPGNIFRHSNGCKACAGKKLSDAQWEGFGEISGGYWASIRLGASKRKKEFDITIEYAWEIFLKQDRKCVLTGIQLYFPEKYNVSKNRSKQTASLDRIDNSKGYKKGNVRWVHKDINYIKRDLNDEEFLNYIELIYNHQRKAFKNENS